MSTPLPRVSRAWSTFGIGLGSLVAVAGCGDATEAGGGEEETLVAVERAPLSGNDCRKGYDCASPTVHYSGRFVGENGCGSARCGQGEGDCDGNADCKAGMACVFHRGGFFGLQVDRDYCWPAADVCRDLGPCSAGEGDCDDTVGKQGPRQCAEGAVCNEGAGSEVCTTRPPEDLGSVLDDFTVTAPGWTAAVFDHEGLVAIGSRGRARADVAGNFLNDDRVLIASNTKAMTGALALVLDRLSASIDFSTTPYPAYHGMRPEYFGVALDDFLGHRSGVAADPALPPDNLSLKSQRILVSQTALAAPPVTPIGQFSYGNLNYLIAASLLEITYGGTYENLMVDKIFRPLGMDSCAFGVPERVMGHTLRSAGPPIQWNVITAPPARVFNSAGLISCSLKDWGKFLREYIRYDKSALLPPSSYDKIFNSTTGYEAGFFLVDPSWSDEPYLGHAGWFNNHSIVYVSPKDDIAIIVFANADPPGMDSQLEAVARRLGELYAAP